MSTIGERNVLNINHNNIVKTLEIIQNQEGNFSLIIMEYFPNSKQLQTLLADCDFDIDDKIPNFAVDICNGLDFIHRKGILHLDIKPQNVLVAENVCKICDFGNSVLLTDTENFSHQVCTRLKITQRFQKCLHTFTGHSRLHGTWTVARETPYRKMRCLLLGGSFVAIEIEMSPVPWNG